jgi:CRP/FNR family cyclic AMP-dependent transcriptional regulator
MADEPRSHPDASHGVRLLVVDDELGRGLDEAALEEARMHAVVPAIELQPGSLAIDALREAPGVRGHLHGLFVIEGTLGVHLRMSGRTCTKLVAERELVLLDGVEGDSIPLLWEWAVLAPARLALLDERLHALGRQWPALLTALLERAAQQTRNALLQQAISQLPRVEERLLALFWAIADRQGVVRSDGVWVPLTATHDLLAQMVGAQRPTVSLGLGRLADGGLVRSEDDGWLLARDSISAFAQPPPPPAAADADARESDGRSRKRAQMRGVEESLAGE